MCTIICFRQFEESTRHVCYCQVVAMAWLRPALLVRSSNSPQQPFAAELLFWGTLERRCRRTMIAGDAATTAPALLRSSVRSVQILEFACSSALRLTSSGHTLSLFHTFWPTLFSCCLPRCAGIVCCNFTAVSHAITSP